MPNFEPDFLSLSEPAKNAMKEVEMGLKLFAERNMEVSEIKLYPRHWDALDKSLRKASNGDMSLATHRYRGVKLVRLKVDRPTKM